MRAAPRGPLPSALASSPFAARSRPRSSFPSPASTAPLQRPADTDEVAYERRASEFQLEGRTEEALGCLEASARLRRQRGAGPNSPRLRRTMHAVADLCNALAMQRLTVGDFDAAKALLQRAEGISEKETSLRAITYNNLACLHRRQGNLRTALQYLHSALDIESKLASAHNPSDTHLNISAIQSQLGRHELALEHAQAALVMLHDELFEHDTASTLDGSAPFPAAAPERMSVLAIAYHNMGSEFEFLRRWEDALLAYKRAMQLARLHVGDANPVTRTLSQAYESARATISLKIRQRDADRDRRRGGAGGLPRASSSASLASGRHGTREPSASAARPRSANASPARAQAASMTVIGGLPIGGLQSRDGDATPPSRARARSRPSSALHSRERWRMAA